MRVLLVSHRYPPLHRAGTEIYSAQLATRLAQLGHEVLVFTAEKDISRPQLALTERRHEGVPVLELVNNLLYEGFRDTWELEGAERAFAAVLERVRPEVVHFQHLLHLSSGCLDAAAQSGAAVLFTLHDFWLSCPRHGQRLHVDGTVCFEVELERCTGCMVGFRYGQGALEKRVAGLLAGLRSATGLDLAGPARRARALLAGPESVAPPADEAAVERMRAALLARDAGLRERLARTVDLFLSPSRFLRERFVAWGIPPERIEHLPTGVDLESPGARSRTPRGARLRVAFAGTLIPAKGPRLLLQAWAALPEALRGRAELRIAGSARHEPDYQRELAELARRSGALLVGELSRARVGELLSSTDLLVVPSLWYENAPLVILEALAARTPLLVSDQGGMAELVEEGQSGFHFRMGDAADLAAKLAALIEDPAPLDGLYARPPALPSVAEHVAALLERYRALLAARAPRRVAPDPSPLLP